ncbi:MAG: ribosome biogenesis GTP-binding protein YihA/YsxC [Clostridia bacterium]|nr:ribosome biogenesis GTP-binding protein YihA/YsxC [Clostridia bacterium]
MKITKAKFITSMSAFRELTGKVMPEIALAGKSNVGKSSMINHLTHNGKLAKTSSEPGKTRLVNYYSVNEDFYLVDLPGYGFARASKMEKDKWASMIEGYFEHSTQLRHVLQLVDIRHAPTEEDVMMVNYLRHYDIPFTVLATKADKLSKAQRGRSLPVICRTLVVQPWEIIPWSSEDDTGMEPLLTKIEAILSENQQEG